MELIWGLLLISAVSLGADEPEYALLGGDLVLKPEIPAGTAVTSLLWKLNLNKVAEWDPEFGNQIDFYGTFAGRTELNLKTGQLVVKRFTEKDSGTYSLELNGQPQTPAYNVIGINPVQVPTVSLKPLSCSKDSEDCTLSCTTNTKDSGPLTYSWRRDDGDHQPGESLQPISKQDKDTKLFYCGVENPRSKAESSAVENPFYHAPRPVPIIVGVILVVIASIGFIVLVLYFKFVKKSFPCWPRSEDGGVNRTPVEISPLMEDGKAPSDTREANIEPEPQAESTGCREPRGAAVGEGENGPGNNIYLNDGGVKAAESSRLMEEGKAPSDTREANIEPEPQAESTGCREPRGAAVGEGENGPGNNIYLNVSPGHQNDQQE